MQSYILKNSEIQAKKYEIGDEDGFRLYFCYEKYDEGLHWELFMVFKNLKDLLKWKDKMTKKQNPNNKLIFEDPTPVIQTIYGFEDVFDDEYIILDNNNNKLVMHRDNFEFLFQKC